MSTLLPSKTSKIVKVIVPYLRPLTYKGMQTILEFCRIQSAIFIKTDLNSDDNKIAREKIFTLCKKLKIAILLPPVFYDCVCEASDVISNEDLAEPMLFGCTILA